MEPNYWLPSGAAREHTTEHTHCAACSRIPLFTLHARTRQTRHTHQTARTHITHSARAGTLHTAHTHAHSTHIFHAHLSEPTCKTHVPSTAHAHATYVHPPPATGGPWHCPSPSSLTPRPWGTRWTAVASPRQKRWGTSTCFSRDRDLEAFTCANTSALQVCIARHL